MYDPFWKYILSFSCFILSFFIPLHHQSATAIMLHLSHQTILNIADRVETLPKISYGVYFLLAANGRILYVGSSMRLQNRIEQHRQKGVIPFARFAAYPEHDRNTRLKEERESIRFFRPPYNTGSNPSYNPAHRAAPALLKVYPAAYHSFIRRVPPMCHDTFPI